MDQADREDIMIHDIEGGKRNEQLSLTNYNVIRSRNIFSKVDKSPAKEDTIRIDTLEPTSLKIRLLGTIAGNQQNTLAIIEEISDKTQALYRVGDSVQEGIIKSIFRGKVVLGVGDRDEILMMGDSGRDDSEVRESTGRVEVDESVSPYSTITLRRSKIDEALANITDILSQATISAHMDEGSPDGIEIADIVEGSIYSTMGLGNGDIIYGVNNNELKSPDDIISLYNKLRAESDISLQIKRMGKEITLLYRLMD